MEPVVADIGKCFGCLSWAAIALAVVTSTVAAVVVTGFVV